MAQRSSPAYLREYRRPHVVEIRAQKRDYYERTGNRYIKEWRSRNPEKRARYREDWKRNHPEKVAAHDAVWNAIHAGKLRPAKDYHCVDCGAPAMEYDHYLGYAEQFRLCIQPVCRKCHGARRRMTDDCQEELAA